MNDSGLNAVTRLLAPIKNRIMMMIGRAVLTAVDDSKGIQLLTMSLLNAEVRDKIERMQNYGFTSHPKPNAEGIVVFPGGDRSHGICIVCDDRTFRLKPMAEGEVALYSDEGDYVWLKRDRKMFINTMELTVDAGTKVVVNTPDATVNCQTAEVNATSQMDINTPTLNISDDVNIGGNLDVTGNIDSGATITAATNVQTTASGGISLTEVQSAYNSHTHQYDDDGSAETTSGPNNSV